MNDTKNWRAASPRGMVLAVLGVVTLGVAVLSMAVSYDILEPKFGAWAVPTVGALDALWVVFQMTEILAANNRSRARRVQYAGLALTAVNAAIPTVDLALRLHSSGAGFSLAVVITPIAIVATKTAWWIALPSLGRRVSTGTRREIATRRQKVADQLEEMEADIADRIELLNLARDLNERVAEAETGYRLSVLKTQQSMTEDLHQQAEATASTVQTKALPVEVAAIQLPELDTWTPAAPALPVTAHCDASSTDLPAVPGRRDDSVTPAGERHAGQGDFANIRHSGGHAGSDGDRDAVTLADLAVVAGVPTPQPGEPLTGGQLDVVLRHLRYSDDPPLSYRQAVGGFRDRGFVGSEKRVRHAWGALLSNEENGEADETGTPDEADRGDESEDADA
ncbi:hypothetical protein AB0N62_37460 [Streptomyces sp. NPDC093982]|uniref:hypothetical protein n=1 Tax=Streptomyces sp. NPDC093982 TaxID=3155077 RepID=UPI003448CC59